MKERSNCEAEKASMSQDINVCKEFNRWLMSRVRSIARVAIHLSQRIETLERSSSFSMESHSTEVEGSSQGSRTTEVMGFMEHEVESVNDFARREW